MARCCGPSAGMKVEPGRLVTVTGTGAPSDPFVIANQADVESLSNKTFDLVLSGTGTQEDPWLLEVRYAATASLSDVPDVATTAPTNGQVLSWNSSSGQWTPAAPTTAAAGAVTRDTTLRGDGSSGSPLGVQEDSTRYIQIGSAGVGLSDAGIARLVRPFADASARAASTIMPILGSLSMLNTAPGRIDYWDGDSWEPITNGVTNVVSGGELMQISGAYVAGGALTRFIKQFSATTDFNGNFDILTAADLSGRAGVLTCMVQFRGFVPLVVGINPGSGKVSGRVYRADSGTAYGSTALTGYVEAMLY